MSVNHHHFPLKHPAFYVSHSSKKSVYLHKHHIIFLYSAKLWMKGSGGYILNENVNKYSQALVIHSFFFVALLSINIGQQNKHHKLSLILIQWCYFSVMMQKRFMVPKFVQLFTCSYKNETGSFISYLFPRKYQLIQSFMMNWLKLKKHSCYSYCCCLLNIYIVLYFHLQMIAQKIPFLFQRKKKIRKKENELEQKTRSKAFVMRFRKLPRTTAFSFQIVTLTLLQHTPSIPILFEAFIFGNNKIIVFLLFPVSKAIPFFFLFPFSFFLGKLLYFQINAKWLLCG